MACKGRPVRKCPGVNTSTPSSLLCGITPSGQLLRQASTSARRVGISSKSSLESPITLVRCVLKLFTAASHNPPKWSARSGMKCQQIPQVEQKSQIAYSVFFESRKMYRSLRSLQAATKLVPWSLQMEEDFPLRKDLVERSETSSR